MTIEIERLNTLVEQQMKILVKCMETEIRYTIYIIISNEMEMQNLA